MDLKLNVHEAQDYDEESSDSDQKIWDDELLNAAYDKALRKAKDIILTEAMKYKKKKKVVQVDGTENEENDDDEEEGIEELNYNDENLEEGEELEEDLEEDGLKQVQDLYQRKIRKYAWFVGDPCTARYNQDGLLYQADIIKILSKKKCIIRYLGYNNEEIQSLKSLLPSKGVYYRKKQIKKVAAMKEKAKRNMYYTTSEEMEQPSQSNYSFNPNESLPGSSMPSTNAYMNTPTPPQIPLSVPKNERDAFSSMLMSWYITGYHTGFYDAMASSKKNKPEN